MTKEEKIESFNPSSMASGKNLFGLPFDEDESEVVILPVPWEVTVSFAAGTALAPKAILQASKQVDLYDADAPEAWKAGIFMRPLDKNIFQWGKELRKKAEKYFELLEENDDENTKKIQALSTEINRAGASLRDGIQREMRHLLEQGKLPALLGGDHGTPLGFMHALSEFYDDFGILQLDAHCDLRNAYEGLEFSHASIMFNALKIPQVKKIVQVSVRDYCEEELNVMNNSNGRVKIFFDSDLKRSAYNNESWREQCHRIIAELPENVYISFDIDGLDPKLCPHTGTPVAGGFEFEQAVYLVHQMVQSGRKIIGFDLNEVGNKSWDANVGARMLYKLCNLMWLSNRK